MVKKVFKIIGIVMACIVVGIGLVYLMVAFFYNNKFMPNTVVSGISVNAMTADEVNTILMRGNDKYTITLLFSDNKKTELDGNDFDYVFDYSDSLNEIIASQNKFEWPYYAMYQTSYEAEGVSKYDEGKVVALLSALDEYSDDYDNSKAIVKIDNRVNHFTLRDDRRALLNTSRATEDVLACIESSNSECDLSSDYDEPETTDAQQSVLDKWEKLDAVQQAEVTLQDDDLSLVIDKHIFASWVKVNSQGQPVFDSQGNVLFDDIKVDEYMQTVNEKFGTDGMMRKWQKYKGGTVEIPCSWDGYIVDVEAERDALVSAILNGKTESRKPKYSQEGNGHGNAEVGDTYVEVDLGNQKMYFFDKGELKLESDIVSGCKRYHNDTPSMITNIYFMQEGRTLRGENYATFVYYWMAFYNHYGLHDATWRREFGNDIYLTNGSHGCVNLPKEVAGELYGMVEVGTPVVLYE